MQTVLWRDNRNGLPGVCAGGFSQTYPLAAIEKAAVERVFAASGRGDFVRLYLNGHYAPKTVLAAPYGYFNPYFADMAALLEGVVVKLPSGFLHKTLLLRLAGLG